MFPSEDEVMVKLSYEEAWELLHRCLRSPEEDTTLSRRAMQKLASVVESSRAEQRKAS